MRLRVYPTEKLMKDWMRWRRIRVWYNSRTGIALKFQTHTAHPLGWWLTVGAGKMTRKAYSTYALVGMGRVAKSILELREVEGILRMEMELIYAASKLAPQQRRDVYDILRLTIHTIQKDKNFR